MMETIKKILEYKQEYGFKLLLLKMITPKVKAEDYMQWRKAHSFSEAELKKQRDESFSYPVKISIAVPTYNTPIIFLQQMIDSIANQTYGNWELCIADGSDDRSVVEFIGHYGNKDGRIKVKHLSRNLGIAGNTNAALEMTTGEYIGLMDHDDILEESALYEIAKTLQGKDRPDIIYTDEDKVSENLDVFYEPNFKPDFNLEMLRCNNYICHFFLFNRTLLDKTGGFRERFDGAQDYDFILRCVENTGRIEHLARPLYHWRTFSGSTAANPDSKQYAYIAGKCSIDEHLKRMGEQADVMYTRYPGFYRVKYRLPEKERVQIFIFHDEYETPRKKLKQCIQAIKKTSKYDKLTVNIIKKQDMLRKEDIKGDYVILLDSCVKFIHSGWLEEMLSVCQREQVGIVGGKLYNKNETIKHAGIIMGLDGYLFEGFPRTQNGYMHRENLMQELSAVTTKLAMVSKETMYAWLEKFPERKCYADEISFSKFIALENKKIIYDPYIEAYYLGREKRVVHGKTNLPDPYYNKNFNLCAPGYMLKMMK